MLKSMVRCAGSSIAAVSLEFAILSLLVSALHLFYLAGALIAGAVGFFVSFLLNRRWAFRARHGSAPRQLLRHSVVVGGGIALGMLFMWLLISRLHLPYQVGWLGGGAMVFLVWTFPMQRFFTFGASIPDATAA
jgi:putative flippase GtrA